MIVSILAAGSRGDVQPMAALALELSTRGHRVRLIAPAEFLVLLGTQREMFRPLPIDIQGELASRAARSLFTHGKNPVVFALRLYEFLERNAPATISLSCEYIRGSDVVVGTGFVDYLAQAIAEALGIACVHAYLQPLVPSRDFPCPMVPTPPFELPGWLNNLEGHAYLQALWLGAHPIATKISEQLRLAAPGFASPIHTALKAGDRFLMAYSETLVPRGRDWPPNVDVTGYWFLKRSVDWSPPSGLVRFLQSGSKPVYVGFGSMAAGEPSTTAKIVLDALRMNKTRGILSSGWGGLRPNELVDDDVYTVDDIPHDWLFPHVAAVVHHGGAGTTGMALRNGVPQIVVPFIIDQFFWARQVEKQGVGPRGIPFSRLTSPNLAGAMDTALRDDTIRQRAATLGRAVEAEDGVHQAAAAIERVGAQ